MKLFHYKSKDSLGNNCDLYMFKCVGCGREHHIDPKRWTFNYNLDKPTCSPSLKVTWSHPKGYSNDNPAPLGWKGEKVQEICHFFIKEGKFQFCNDCTHDKKGLTIEMLDINLDDWECYS